MHRQELVWSVLFRVFCSLTFASYLITFNAQAQSLPNVEARSQAGDPLKFVSARCTPGVPSAMTTPSAPPALDCQGKFINNSQKPLKAIGIEWDSYDAKGAKFFHSTEVDDYGFPLPAFQKTFGPGEEVSVGADAPPFAAKVVTQTIFVQFADGSVWGDKHSNAYARLVSSRSGARQVIMYLKREKQKVGAEKALEQLGIP